MVLDAVVEAEHVPPRFALVVLECKLERVAHERALDLESVRTRQPAVRRGVGPGAHEQDGFGTERIAGDAEGCLRAASEVDDGRVEGQALAVHGNTKVRIWSWDPEHNGVGLHAVGHPWRERALHRDWDVQARVARGCEALVP